jgi:hypothetical protein
VIRFLLLSCLCGLGFRAASSDVQDSLIIDGRPVKISGTVEWDTLGSNRGRIEAMFLMGSIDLNSYGIPSDVPVDFAALTSVVGAPVTRDLSALSARPRTLGPSLEWMGAGWTIQSLGDARIRPTMRFNWAQMPVIGDLQTRAATDSVIGFLPGMSGTSVRAVTWERYPLGIETDTISYELQMHGQAAIALGGMMGWPMAARDAGEFTLGAGVTGTLGAPVAATWLGRPDPYREGPAFQTAAEGRRLQPWIAAGFMQGATARSLRRRPGQSMGFADRVGWQVQARWQPQGVSARFGFFYKW